MCYVVLQCVAMWPFCVNSAADLWKSIASKFKWTQVVVAVCCGVSRCVALLCLYCCGLSEKVSGLEFWLDCVVVCCSVLQCVATQHTAALLVRTYSV